MIQMSSLWGTLDLGFVVFYTDVAPLGLWSKRLLIFYTPIADGNLKKPKTR